LDDLFHGLAFPGKPGFDPTAKVDDGPEYEQIGKGPKSKWRWVVGQGESGLRLIQDLTHGHDRTEGRSLGNRHRPVGQGRNREPHGLGQHHVPHRLHERQACRTGSLPLSFGYGENSRPEDLLSKGREH